MNNELSMVGGMVKQPEFLPDEVIDACKTYRDAVRVSWEYRRIKQMHRCTLAERIDRKAQHVSDYLAQDDEPHRRNLPADSLDLWACAVGNFGVQQWLNRQSKLTILEEVIAQRAAA